MQIRDQYKIDFNVLILAGGHSSRMHYPKVWLPFDDSHTFLENIVSSYLELGCSKVVVVLNVDFLTEFEQRIDNLPSNVDLVVNNDPVLGRIHSIQLGIQSLNSSLPTVIHNVDNPFVNKKVIESLLIAENKGYVKPVFEGKGGHPIVVTKKVLDTIMNCSIENNLRNLLNLHPCSEVPVNDYSIFSNINTPDEYERAFQRKVPKIV